MYDTEIINNGENKVEWIADYLLRSDDELLGKLAPKYGLKKDDFVIVVGPQPITTAKIALIMKYLGIDNVYVMSGAYNEWDLNGYALEKEKSTLRRKVQISLKSAILMLSTARMRQQQCSMNLTSISLLIPVPLKSIQPI